MASKTTTKGTDENEPSSSTSQLPSILTLKRKNGKPSQVELAKAITLVLESPLANLYFTDEKIAEFIREQVHYPSTTISNIQVTNDNNLFHWFREPLIREFKRQLPDTIQRINENKSHFNRRSPHERVKTAQFISAMATHLRKKQREIEAELIALQEFVAIPTVAKEVVCQKLQKEISQTSLFVLTNTKMFKNLALLNTSWLTEIRILEAVELDSSIIRSSDIYNWPDVAVSLWTPAFVFRRSNIHEVESSITTRMAEPPLKVNALLADERYFDEPPTVAYSAKTLRKYFLDIIGILNDTNKKVNTENAQMRSLIAHIADVFVEIVKDVETIYPSRNTLPLNTLIQYCTSHFNYTTTNHTNNNGLSLTFYITPKMQLEFKARDDELKTKYPDLERNREIFTKLLHSDKSPRKLDMTELKECCASVNYFLSFKCLLCDEECLGKDLEKFTNHLLKEHGYWSKPLHCVKCRKEFQFTSLLMNRWTHGCS